MPGQERIHAARSDRMKSPKRARACEQRPGVIILGGGPAGWRCTSVLWEWGFEEPIILGRRELALLSDSTLSVARNTTSAGSVPARPAKGMLAARARPAVAGDCGVTEGILT